MFLTNFYNQHHGKNIHVSDFWLYELSVWLHVIAYSLISVFVPILLYTTGFSIADIMLYYAIYYLTDVPLNFLARSFIIHFGARASVALGTIFIITFFSLFSLLGPNDWYILLTMAVVAALYDTFYWVGHVYLFINSSGKDKDIGRKTSTVAIVRKIGSIIAPLVGATVLIFANNATLMYVGIFIFTLSLIPLFWVDEFKDRPTIQLVSFKKFFKHMREKKNYITMMLLAVHSSTEGILLPLFIFTIFKSIESVAFIPVIIGFSTIALTYFAGGIKKGKRELVIMAGAFAIAVVWLARILIEGNNYFYYISIFLVGIFTLFISIPLDSNLFTRGKEIDSLQTATYRNATNMFAKFIFFSIGALLLNVFYVGFVIALLSMLSIFVVNYIFLIFITRNK